MQPAYSCTAIIVALGLVLAVRAEGDAQPAAPRWKVTVESVSTVFQHEEDTNFPLAELFPNGDIVLHFSIGQHVVNERGMLLISHDRGATWQPASGIPSMLVARLGGQKLVALSAWGGKEGEGGLFTGTLYTSEDGGGHWTSERVPIRMPPGTVPYTHRSMVAMPDGSLLATYYGHRPGQAKYHSGLLRSTDQGKTWEYFGDIAYDPDAPSEGYCEPVMVRLRNGDLLCMLRTGGPMYQTRSSDGGKTWSKPEQVMDHGVCPDLCLMSNGVLVCSYGRPNAGIMFSYDGTGKRWEDARDLYRGVGSSYTTVRELEPGLLLYFYDQSKFCNTPGPGPLNEIRMARIRVARE